MANGALVVSLLIGMTILIFFGAVWRITGSWDPVDARLRAYGGLPRRPVDNVDVAGRRGPLSALRRALMGFGLAPRLAGELSLADVPVTAAEFMLIIILLAIAGYVVGAARMGTIFGLILAGLMAYLPFFYLRIRASQRKRRLTEQLPDVLALLISAMRAGYGLTQALDVIIGEIPAPASIEFQRVMRAVNLGVPVQRALIDMADRVGIEDYRMLVSAINVQYETGGNLVQTLETISETVYERIRLLREIRVMTAQQRLTGYFLVALPIGLTLVLMLINPEYMGRLFAPGWQRILPIIAGLMQLAGYLVIRRIVDIEV